MDKIKSREKEIYVLNKYDSLYDNSEFQHLRSSLGYKII